MVMRGPRHAFVSMNIYFPKDGTVHVDIKTHLREAIEAFGEPLTRSAATPAWKDLYTKDEDDKPLDEEIIISKVLTTRTIYLPTSSSHTMVTTLPTIDVRYLTTNSPPPPTTHLALNVCEALRRPSLCKVRDVKDEDKLVHLASGLFSRKQLPAALCLELRKQKPLSNALDGSYLLCKEHMLQTQ